MTTHLDRAREGKERADKVLKEAGDRAESVRKEGIDKVKEGVDDIEDAAA